MAKVASETVGIVFAGSGARGAYEAGAFAELLPVLEAHGRRPTIFVGTSAGAVNAVLFVGPSRASGLGQLADEVFQARYGNGRWLRQPLDFPVLNQLLGGCRRMHCELVSYLFFEPDFIQRTLALGQQDARRLLAQSPDGLPWQMTA